jgi:DNA-binding LytR/AlgR family response regulator
MNALKIISNEFRTTPKIHHFLPGKIVISTHTRIDLIEISDIQYIRAESNYSRIVTKDRSILASTPIKKFITRLEDITFCRVHASFLINLDHLLYINKTGQYSCVMENGDRIPISLSYKKIFIGRILENKL